MWTKSDPKKSETLAAAHSEQDANGTSLIPPPLELKSDQPIQRFWGGITDWFSDDEEEEATESQTGAKSTNPESSAASPPGPTGNPEVDAFVSDLVDGYIPSFEAANETLNCIEWWTDSERKLVQRQLKAWRNSGALGDDPLRAVKSALATIADFTAEDMAPEPEAEPAYVEEKEPYSPADDAVDDEVPEEGYGPEFFDGEEIDPEEEEAYQKEQAENPGIVTKAIGGAVNGIIDLG
ncbi:MAG: hypothetical protein AAFV07_19965, partial [Bacteroidota bacterium]